MARSASPPPRPVPHTCVRLRDRFWGPRQETNRRVTLPIQHRQCRDTGRLDAWTLAWKPGDPNPPHIFWDSDVAKWIEAAAYSLADHPDRRLQAHCDAVIALMARAQRPDGYLNTHFIAVEPEKRWTNLRDWHELYCAGHLMEAAVAYAEATGRRRMLDVLCRYADHIATVFGPRRHQKRGYPGHPEIELALVKLYRATGRRRYLDLARFFVNERGRQPHYYDLEARARGEDPAAYWAKTYAYTQAHRPLRQQSEITGHAVRACYLYAGMADVAAETGDTTLLPPLRRIWDDLTLRKMYLTGGIGPSAHNEGFTVPYDLPNESAYAETCAAIALVFWARRMVDLEPDARYTDVMERALYNGVLSGVSRDGQHFFYANPLAAHPPSHTGHFSLERQEWFGCACCPPNLARLLASLGGYLYSQGPGLLRVHLYAAGEARLAMGRTTVRLVQDTDYPWDGHIRLTLHPARPVAFTLALRIPGWCRKAKLRFNGERLDLADITRNGYAEIARTWRAGDTVELALAMPVERVQAHPEARHDSGRVALQRGPLVYCLEECDNGPRLHDLRLPDRARVRAKWVPDLLGGVVALTGKARRRRADGWDNTLYRPATEELEKLRFRAVPYALWANRGKGEMAVWLLRG